VEDNFHRIGKIERLFILPIIPSEHVKYYRNKLEFTFSSRRWMTDADKAVTRNEKELNALGFHLPLLFDRVLDIRQCYLQRDPSNEIRLETKRYALDHDLTFYDARTWKGLMRNLLIRTTGSGELMVILVFSLEEKNVIKAFLDHLIEKFPAITSLYYVINPKKNDAITDLSFHLHYGKPTVSEFMTDHKGLKKIEYRIGPSSFFQTNSAQAQKLYQIAGDFAGFNGNEVVYDLYTGIGSIALFIASSVKQVIAIESIPAAVEDAMKNSQLNGISNTLFFSGEAEKIISPAFIAENGVPDVVITDPPRTGMHQKVVHTLVDLRPEKIVYVSCNPSTQARDISLLKEHYDLIECQPVDMFPHTHHVENVALLQKKD
jgi:23S rRNA (uracil1939-C5)-methyltransferase